MTAFLAPPAIVAQCTTNAAGLTSCTLSGDFTTSGQSMFTTGSGQVSFSGTVGTNWNQSGSVGSIVDVHLGKLDLGDYGATITGSTSGNISLSASAVVSGGTVDASIPVNLSLQVPSKVNPGNQFTVTSNLSYNDNATFQAPNGNTLTGVQFQTQSPAVGFGASIGFGLQASVGAEACFSGCAGFGPTSIVDTGQQTLTVLQYNEVGPVQSAVLGGNKWIALNTDVTSAIEAVGLSGSKDVIPDVLTLTYNVNPSNLNFQSTSSASGMGSYLASGMTPNTVVGLDLNVVNAVTSALDLPPGSGNLGDLICTDLGVSCSSAVSKVLSHVDYNLLSADATLGISPSQEYSMNLNGATLGLQVLDQHGQAIAGDSATLNADGSATLTYPTRAADGSTISSISIVPTLTIDNPTFTTQTGLSLVPGFEVSALGLSAGPLSLGPLFDYSASIPPIPQLTLATQTFGLGGFNTLQLTSGMPTVGLSTTQVDSTTLSANMNFLHADVTGLPNSTLAYSSLTINDSYVKGATFNGNSILNTVVTATVSSDVFYPQSTLDHTTFNLGSDNKVVTQGNVVMSNSTITASSPAFLEVQNGTLTLQNTQIGNTKLQADPGTTVTMTQQSSLTGGVLVSGGSTLTLNSSSLTMPDNSPYISSQVNGTLNLLNGATVKIGQNDSLFLGGGATINVGNGTVLESDFRTEGSGGTINIASGGTFTAGGSLSLQSVNINGGIVNLESTVVQGTSFLNGNLFALGGHSGVLDVSGSSALNGTVIGSMGTVGIAANATLDLEGAYIFSDSIVNNGEITGGSTSPNPTYIYANSFTNNGTIGGNNLQIYGPVINTGLIEPSRGGSLLLNEVSDQGGFLFVGTGETVTVSGAVTAINPDGSVVVSGLTQSDGFIDVNGTLSSPVPILAAGGTVAGGGTISGSLVNAGAMVDPGGCCTPLGDGLPDLTITGDYTQNAGGSLLIDVIDGFTTKLVVGGNAKLAGTLEVLLGFNFISGLVAGETLDILDSGSLSGQFGDFVFLDTNGLQLPFGDTWGVTESGNSVFLTWATTDCASLGQDLLNGSIGSGNCSSSLPPDGTIPADFGTQYTGQKGTFSFVTFSSGTSAPEPAGALLVAFGLAALGARLAFRRLRA